jgi:hypothetical protein
VEVSGFTQIAVFGTLLVALVITVGQLDRLVDAVIAWTNNTDLDTATVRSLKKWYRTLLILAAGVCVLAVVAGVGQVIF